MRFFCRPYFLLSDSALEECSTEIEQCSELPYDAVVIGLAPSMFTYEHLNTAFRILVNEHASQKQPQPQPQQPPQPPPTTTSSSPKPKIPLIATHKAKYLESTDGALSLGPGPFVTALEHASGQQAEIVGKPSRGFFQTVIGNFQPEELAPPQHGAAGVVAVIGDDVEMDLGGGAVELGLWRVLGELLYYQ